MKNINVKELHEKIQSGEIKTEFVIDVRTKAENESEKITDTINIPLNELQNKDLDFNKNDSLYIYCATGNRSQIACHLLKSKGFENCYNVDGGIAEWKRQGFEIEKSEKKSVFGFFG